MGRMLGSTGGDELDRPDLNKCPDCQCYFAGLNCPLCGKLCPEEMRAGNRKPVKVKTHRNTGNGRVTFVEWYHSWWFIVLMMFVMPIMGIILLLTSPHERWKKVLLAVIAVIYLVASTFGIGAIWSAVTRMWDHPVNADLPKEEYLAACTEVSAEQFYRAYGEYEDDYVKLRLKVVGKGVYLDSFYYASDDIYYVCTSEDRPEITILVRSCLLDGETMLIAGDVITVYGEAKDLASVYVDATDTYVDGPLVNMAYVTLEE